MGLDGEFKAAYAAYEDSVGNTHRVWGVAHPDYGFAPFEGDNERTAVFYAARFQAGQSDPDNYSWVEDYILSYESRLLRYAALRNSDGVWGVMRCDDHAFAPMIDKAQARQLAEDFITGDIDPATYDWEGGADQVAEPEDKPQRATFASGMVRDTADDKPRFDLLVPAEQPYQETLLYRWAAHMGKGAAHYGDRNWEKAQSDEEYQRFRQSAFRHFMQWFTGQTDEDHAAAVLFNIAGAEYTKGRMT